MNNKFERQTRLPITCTQAEIQAALEELTAQARQTITQQGRMPEETTKHFIQCIHDGEWIVITMSLSCPCAMIAN